MVESYFTINRKVNKKALCDFIVGHPEMPLNKAVGLFSYNTGLRKATLMGYIEELRDAGLID